MIAIGTKCRRCIFSVAMGDNRTDDGRFRPEHTDGDILAAVRAHEPAATSEVAGELGMTRQGADRRLRQLRDDGSVNSKKIGASLVWFTPEQPAASRGQDSHEDAVDRTDSPPEYSYDRPDRN